MIKFEKNILINELALLSAKARIAFATATATRQLGNYEQFAQLTGVETEHHSRAIVNKLWTDLSSKTMDCATWSATLDEVMNMMPEENEDWIVWHALAEDALSSLAYSIRCLLNPDAQNPAWAAQCAYEAADQAAIRMLDVQPGLHNTEMKVLSHDCVQRELVRQRNDLDLLPTGSIDQVRGQAEQSKLLTQEEAAYLIALYGGEIKN